MEELFTRPKYWEILACDLKAAFCGKRIPPAHHLRHLHYAGRSVVRPETVQWVPQARIRSHIAREKTASIWWQEVILPWVGETRRREDIYVELVAALVAETSSHLSLIAIIEHPLMRDALEQNGFVRYSPKYDLYIR